jgi:hypothetical protein
MEAQLPGDVQVVVPDDPPPGGSAENRKAVLCGAEVQPCSHHYLHGDTTASDGVARHQEFGKMNVALLQ